MQVDQTRRSSIPGLHQLPLGILWHDLLGSDALEDAVGEPMQPFCDRRVFRAAEIVEDAHLRAPNMTPDTIVKALILFLLAVIQAKNDVANLLGLISWYRNIRDGFVQVFG